jgi:HSP20 family protein
MGETSAAVQQAKEPISIKPAKPEGILDWMNEIFDAISRRAFEIFESNGQMSGHEFEDWFKAESELLHPVHVHMTESNEAIDVEAEVPGFNEKEIEISVEPRRLTITGKRESKNEQKKGKTVYSETCSDQVFRTVELPAEVETDKATATLKNGMLHLAMPKAAKARSVRIQAKSAA